MNRVPVYCSKDLKRVQGRIYNALETRTPYIVSGNHECRDKERYEYLAEKDPSVLLIETHSGMLRNLTLPCMFITNILLELIPFLITFVPRVTFKPSEKK